MAFVLFASLFVVNPASAAEETDLAAQKTAIGDGRVTAMSIAETALPSVGAEASSIDQNVASEAATELELLTPAAGNVVDGVVVLPETGEVHQAVLEVSRKGDMIAPAVVVLEKDFEYFVPVKSLAEILKFPSTLDASGPKIEGEFFNPENRYAIDVAAKTYTVLGETFPLPENAVLQTEGEESNDIYLTVDALNKIWPLELEVDILEQSLSINAKRKIPIELEQERKKRQEKLERKKEEKKQQDKIEENYVYTPNGYRLLGPQTLYLSQGVGWNKNQRELTNNIFVGGEGDILGASANYSLNLAKTKDAIIELQDFNFRLRRQDYKSGKLLPFNLNLIDVGDISVRTPSLVAGSLQGSGIFVSTDRNNRDIDFDEVTIEGRATPGWDVEVYSRGALIDYGTVDELGLYRFENVPISFGNNPIRVVLYGPQGEVEERIENYSIARSFLKPGETTYQAGVVKRGDRVINVDDENDNDGDLASSFRVNRGINRYLSAYATFTDLPVRDESKRFVSLGANFNALGGYGQIEAYKQLDKGQALDLRFARSFFGFDTSVRSAVFNNFESQKSGIGNSSKETESSVSVARSFALPYATLNLSLSADRTTYADEKSYTNINANQSLSSSIGNFSHTLNSTYLGGDLNKTDGQIAFNRTLSDNFGMNARLGYEAYPEKEFETLNLSLNYSDHDRLTGSLGYGQSLINTNSRSVTLGAAYDFDAFRGNVNLDWDSTEGLGFTLGTSTTLGPQGQDNIYEFRRQVIGQPTKLTVRLFEDLNNDGLFDPQDTPIQGARVILNDGKKSGFSDEDGFLNIEPAGNEGLTTIVLDRLSLTQNPFLISAKKDGHITLLRAGTKPHIDFPLMMSGTIDGTVRNQNGESMAGITVQLVNAQGELVGESTTLADGFYSFELVRPGRYIVQVHPSHRVFVPPKTVRVASDDLFIYGADLQVLSNQGLEQAKEAAVADDVGGGRVAHTYHHPAAPVGTEKPVATSSGGGVQPAVGASLSENGVQPVIRAVRFGENPGKVRLVLDLSDPSDYQITKSDNGSVITVDLPNTKWEAKSNLAPGKDSLFESFEIQQLPGGGTKITLTGKGHIDVAKDAVLPATAGTNHRIYIDFVRTP